MLVVSRDAERRRVSSHWLLRVHTKNEAEYRGMLCGLDGALNLQHRVPWRPWVQVFGDSDVVIQQVNLAPLFNEAMSTVRDLQARGCRVTFAQLAKGQRRRR